MKKMTKVVMTLCLMLILAALPINQMKANAEEEFATVQGTVLKGSTSELLLLSTKEGKMEIKMDSSTDVSGAKIMLPDTKINVTLKHGSDGYLHATKITSDSQTVAFGLDTSNTSTITGSINEKTKGEILYVDTAQGQMEIKLDSTTNMSGVSVLMAGKSYSIVCARGNDAYMHAISISDSGSTGYSSSTTVTSTTNHQTMPSISSDITTLSVTGTVGSSTKESLLYLKTSDGEMEFKIDGNADTIDGIMLITGNKLTVTFYHGTDGYLHAIRIKGEKESTTAQIDNSSTATVTGTVESNSTEKILYLNTVNGKMELKLDTINSINNCKVLVSGKKVSLTCVYGSDAYMHAVDITGL